MSENLIYCYSGSGNCLDMAKNIAKELGDTEIVMMRSFPVKTDATEAKRVGFIFPCYGGGLPGNVESYVKAIHIGSITKHRARYHNANITAEELTEKTFRIE